MKRRDAVKTIPLSIAGIMGLPGIIASYPEKPLGLQYTSKVRDLLKKIKSTQSEEMLEASYRIANTIKNNRKCYFNWDLGHSNPYDVWPDRPGNTDIIEFGIPDDVQKGDLLLCNSYQPNLEELHTKGAFLIGGPRPWGGDNIGTELLMPEYQKMKIKPIADLWIELYATSYGAIINVPGEIAPMGPVSGVVGMMTFWMIISDAARLLAADGIKFNVYGDEPDLGRSAVNVDINSPLGDIYYDIAVSQQKAIDLQFDTVNSIASMAVHSVLTGGRVYLYSRYSDNLCAEGTVRRGGLGLTFGVSGSPDNLILMDDSLQSGKADLNFQPTDRDTVIMGIGKPDDPDDLASLDIFKKVGAGTAAIGPETRDSEIPSGRTVSKETDMYIGDMMDTYGVFALPGIKKKIAPTSGLINNQIFWAVCCQIAEQIIERTGNTPGIYLSGALKGGMEKLNEVKRIYRERGY